MGASLGGLSGKPLQDTTKAVIGLQASIQKIDLQTTMMLFAKAAAGDFATLSRYGIKLDASLSKQEKFNKLLEIGGEKFVLAEGRTKTYLGTVEQMKNTLGDTKEVIGEALMPTFLEWAKTVKDCCDQNQDSISAWAKKTVAAVGLVKNSFKAFLGYMKKDWIDGFEWVFESLLKIIQTTMQTAVMAAIAGGKGIWAGIKKGMLGENEERLNQKIAAMHKAEGSDNIRKIYEGTMAGHVKQIADPKGFVEPLAFGTKKTGTYYRIRAEAEKQLLEADTKKLLGVTWSAIGDTWKDAMKDILNSAPGELQASWRDIWQKFLAKIKQIDATGEAGGALGPLTGGMGGFAGAGGKGAVGEAGSMFRSLNPLISRFLNRDPRNRNNPEERTARATEKIMEYDGTMAGHVKEISDNIRKIAAGGGPQLAEGKL